MNDSEDETKENSPEKTEDVVATTPTRRATTTPTRGKSKFRQIARKIAHRNMAIQAMKQRVFFSVVTQLQLQQLLQLQLHYNYSYNYTTTTTTTSLWNS